LKKEIFVIIGFFLFIPVFAQESPVDDQFITSTELSDRLGNLENESARLVTETINLKKLTEDMNQKIGDNNLYLSEKLDNISDNQILSNALSFQQTVAGVMISVAIAGLIFIITHFQSIKIEKLVTSNNKFSTKIVALTEEINKITKSQSSIKTEKEIDAYIHLQFYLGLIHTQLKIVESDFVKYEGETETANKDKIANRVFPKYDEIVEVAKKTINDGNLVNNELFDIESISSLKMILKNLEDTPKSIDNGKTIQRSKMYEAMKSIAHWVGELNKRLQTRSKIKK